MADKKLLTYDCTLCFQFQTKDDDFMNPDFKFGHIGLVLDVENGGSITLIGNSNSKHPFIFADLKNAVFACESINTSKLTAEDIFNADLYYFDVEALSDCIFVYQPIVGSRFLFGVKEKEFSNEKNKIESSQKSEKFQRRSRHKKA